MLNMTREQDLYSSFAAQRVTPSGHPLGPFFHGGGGEARHATLSAPLSASLHASFGSVAFLWGARKATDSPMSVDLVVDHITEGDRTNYAVDNLQ